MSRGNFIPFLLPFTIPASFAVSRWFGGDWWLRTIFWLFVAVIMLDGLFRPSRTKHPCGSDTTGRWGRFFRRLPARLWLPAQLVIMAGALDSMANRATAWPEFIAVAFSIGMTAGILGAPAAHELMHRRSWLDRSSAELLMVLMSFPHFCIAHIQIHHRHVATHDDPETARLGESLYRFIPRAVAGGYTAAWRNEAERLRRSNRWRAGLGNGVLRGTCLVLLMYCGIAYWFGAAGVLLLLLQSLVAISILESVNYVQHYGLTRICRDDGSYEAVNENHSWNSDEPVGNWLIWNLGLHSFHHRHPAAEYWLACRHPTGPRLPTGLFGMCVLALFPPLWASIMEPLLASYRSASRPSLATCSDVD